MSRQIQKNLNRLNPPLANDYKERLIKMIPGDVVAAYLACNTAIFEFAKDNYTAYWIVFGIIVFLTPFYLKRIMEVTDVVQIVIMTTAFILWCITIDKPFDSLFDMNINSQKLFSTLALTIFTFTVPIFYKGK